MADENQNAESAPSKEDLKNAPKLKVNGFYTKDVSFESPLSPAVFVQKTEQPKLEMSVDVVVSKIEGTAFEVALKINAQANIEEGALFIVELLHAGIFVLNPELEQDDMEKTLLIDCPNILFPYARRIVSDLTQDGGFAPLILDPVNFEAIYAQKKQQAA